MKTLYLIILLIFILNVNLVFSQDKIELKEFGFSMNNPEGWFAYNSNQIVSNLKQFDFNKDEIDRFSKQVIKSYPFETNEIWTQLDSFSISLDEGVEKMKELSSLNPYLAKYKYRILFGVIFIALSNWFGVFPAQTRLFPTRAVRLQRVSRDVFQGLKSPFSLGVKHLGQDSRGYIRQGWCG